MVTRFTCASNAVSQRRNPSGIPARNGSAMATGQQSGLNTHRHQARTEQTNETELRPGLISHLLAARHHNRCRRLTMRNEKYPHRRLFRHRPGTSPSELWHCTAYPTNVGSHLGSPLNPGRPVLTRGVSRHLKVSGLCPYRRLTERGAATTSRSPLDRVCQPAAPPPPTRPDLLTGNTVSLARRSARHCLLCLRDRSHHTRNPPQTNQQKSSAATTAHADQHCTPRQSTAIRLHRGGLSATGTVSRSVFPRGLSGQRCVSSLTRRAWVRRDGHRE
jgi:hypothetical protein